MDRVSRYYDPVERSASHLAIGGISAELHNKAQISSVVF